MTVKKILGKMAWFIFTISFILFMSVVSGLIIYALNIVSRTLPVFGDCNVLPKNINYKVILSCHLFELTSHGLIEKGGVYDPKWNVGDFGKYKFDHVGNTIYFASSYPGDVSRKERKYGIYKIDLNSSLLKPELLLKTDGWPANGLSISPNGNFLTFRDSASPNNYDFLLLDVETKGYRKIADIFDVWYGPVWLNNYQFIYGGKKTGGKESVKKKHKLYFFDINTKTEKDLHFDGCGLGAVTPNGKEVLISCTEKTFFYNFRDGSTRILKNKKMNIREMIWLPDGKGFLHSELRWRDIGDGPDGGSGLYYYSLEKKKSVRLMKLFWLGRQGGFFLPDNVNINLPDTESNRIVSSPGYKNSSLIKVCNKFWRWW